MDPGPLTAFGAVGAVTAALLWASMRFQAPAGHPGPGRTQTISLGDRMKGYERASESSLDPSLPLLARLDGHAFSKFTSGFAQPFDKRFTLAMLLTTADLLRQFQARTAYCQSDEITLVFLPTPSKDPGVVWQPYDFNGRVQKLSTLMSGYASVRFYHHLRCIVEDQEYGAHVSVFARGMEHPLRDASDEKPFSSKTIGAMAAAHFDARLFQVPTLAEVVNCIYWRNAFDCVRNVVSKAGSHQFGHKAMHKKNTGEKIAALKAAGADPEMLHPAILVGCFVKLERVISVGDDGPFERRHPIFFSTLVGDQSILMSAWETLFESKVLDRCSTEFRNLIIERPIQITGSGGK